MGIEGRRQAKEMDRKNKDNADMKKRKAYKNIKRVPQSRQLEEMMSSASASFSQLISPGLQQTFEVGVTYSEGRSFMGEGRGPQVSFDNAIHEQP